MDEKRTEPNTVRPTKKQRELLDYIDSFIAEHGYSPSYREIMRGCNYTSVATVALHINSLISRGHLVKRGRSARSLELTKPSEQKLATNQIKPGEERWLVEKVECLFDQVQQEPEPAEEDINQLRILISALKTLGLDGAAHSFSERLSTITKTD